MEAGSLRHRVVIQQAAPAAPTAYGAGGPPVYSNFATVFAAIEPQTGRQLEYARSFAATVSHKITVRYLAGVLPTMRVLYSGRVFQINAVTDPDERRRQLTLYCTEIVAT